MYCSLLVDHQVPARKRKAGVDQVVNSTVENNTVLAAYREGEAVLAKQEEEVLFSPSKDIEEFDDEGGELTLLSPSSVFDEEEEELEEEEEDGLVEMMHKFQINKKDTKKKSFLTFNGGHEYILYTHKDMRMNRMCCIEFHLPSAIDSEEYTLELKVSKDKKTMPGSKTSNFFTISFCKSIQCTA